MFNIDWILARADEPPDPLQSRRPGLLARRQAGTPIKPARPLSSELKNQIGDFPADIAGLDSGRTTLPPEVGTPGSPEWAAAVAVFDSPTVAIPLKPHDDIGRVCLAKAFRIDSETYRLITLELRRSPKERGRPSTATLGAVRIIEGSGENFIERAREHFERLYMDADPNWRDRLISEDRALEPLLLYIDDDDERLLNVRASSATFGIAVQLLRTNIARDNTRLVLEVSQLAPRMVGAILCEPLKDGSLAWVADQITTLVGHGTPVERLPLSSLDELRALVRIVLSGAHRELAPPSVLTLPTCPRCQPGIAGIIEDEKLAVATAAARDGELCVCERTASGIHSLRIRFAARLVGEPGILIIGYQPNFDVAIDGMQAALVRHIRSAGDEKAIAQKVTLAVIAPGSRMGHSQSARYLAELEANGVRVIVAGGSQLSDVIRALIEAAVADRPGLRVSTA